MSVIAPDAGGAQHAGDGGDNATLPQVLAILQRVTGRAPEVNGSGYLLPCPVTDPELGKAPHKSKVPLLKVWAEKGLVYLKCLAGCKHEVVVQGAILCLDPLEDPTKFVTMIHEPDPGPYRPEIMAPGTAPDQLIGHGDFVRAVVPVLPLGETLFLHAGEVKEVSGGGASGSGVRLTLVTPERMQGVVDDCCHVTRMSWNSKTREWKTQYLPIQKPLAKVVLHNLPCAGIPEIETLSHYPVWTRLDLQDWRPSLPGYNPATKHYYATAPGDAQFQPVPLDPNKQEHRARVASLLAEGPLRYFPFAEESSSIHALAATFTLMMRPGLTKVPIFAVTAPMPRTGKTLICQVIVRMATGHDVAPRVLPTREEEMEKVLISRLRRGDAWTVLDNVNKNQRVDSSTLASIVTSGRTFSGRILGQSQEVTLPNNMVCFLTGNNLGTSREIAARCCPIELVPNDDHPELRMLPDPFAEVQPWVAETLHGMIASWVARGCPPGPSAALPDFGDWLQVIAGILEPWDMATELLGNLGRWKEQADNESDDLERFLIAWHQAGGKEVGKTTEELASLAKQEGCFEDVFMRAPRVHNAVFGKAVLATLLKTACTTVIDDQEATLHATVSGGKNNRRYVLRHGPAPCG